MKITHSSFAVTAAILMTCLPGCSATDATGAGGGGATTSGAGGAGGVSGSKCRPSAVPQISFSLEGKVQSASDGKPTDVDLDGRVTQVSAGTIVIDSCLTPSACGPKLSTLTISAIDLPEKPVPVDALVHVRYHAAFGGSFNAAGAVGQHVVIQNAPTLGTETNLVRSTEIVWLTVDTIDGGAVDVPAGIDPLPLGQVESACGAFPPVYALTLTPPGGKSLAVLVGETGVVNLTGVLQGHYTLRNLNDEADESGNHRGYWVVGT